MDIDIHINISLIDMDMDNLNFHTSITIATTHYLVVVSFFIYITYIEMHSTKSHSFYFS
jgi:hypothetical protein